MDLSPLAGFIPNATSVNRVVSKKYSSLTDTIPLRRRGAPVFVSPPVPLWRLWRIPHGVGPSSPVQARRNVLLLHPPRLRLPSLAFARCQPTLDRHCPDPSPSCCSRTPALPSYSPSLLHLVSPFPPNTPAYHIHFFPFFAGVVFLANAPNSRNCRLAAYHPQSTSSAPASRLRLA